MSRPASSAGKVRPTLTLIQGGGITRRAWQEERVAQLHAEARALLAARRGRV